MSLEPCQIPIDWERQDQHYHKGNHTLPVAVRTAEPREKPANRACRGPLGGRRERKSNPSCGDRANEASKTTVLVGFRQFYFICEHQVLSGPANVNNVDHVAADDEQQTIRQTVTSLKPSLTNRLIVSIALWR